MKKTKKVVYGNSINLSGLWSLKPLKLHWDSEAEAYYDASGNLGIDGLGADNAPGHINFASTNKAEVQAWTDGVKAAMRLLKNWCEVDET